MILMIDIIKIKLQILEALKESPVPLSCYRISEKIGLPVGRVITHLNSLLKDNIIKNENKNGFTYYLLPFNIFCCKGIIINTSKDVKIKYCKLQDTCKLLRNKNIINKCRYLNE